MAHKIKKYSDSDNSRKAFKWRKKHGLETEADKERIEKTQEVRHGSKMESLIQSGEIRTKIKMSKFIARGKK